MVYLQLLKLIKVTRILLAGLAVVERRFSKLRAYKQVVVHLECFMLDLGSSMVVSQQMM